MTPEPDDELWQNRWFDEFSDMADKQLGDGSACEQIHPIVEEWFVEWLNNETPPPRSSVMQALACLSTEVLNITPQPILDALTEHCDEDEVAEWIQNILATGQAFQTALDSGRLDDL